MLIINKNDQQVTIILPGVKGDGSDAEVYGSNAALTATDSPLLDEALCIHGVKIKCTTQQSPQNLTATIQQEELPQPATQTGTIPTDGSSFFRDYDTITAEGWAFIIVLLIIYFLPTLIANTRRHKNENPIALVNLFFGWIGIGWLVALIWSFTSNIKERPSSSVSIITDSILKQCPYCAESIKIEAVVCRYCGKELNDK